MTGRSKVPGGRAARGDRRIQEFEHDTYKTKGKLKEPTVCPECSAVFHKGRWTWGPKPQAAHETLCPACHRIKDLYPKGFLTLKGEFLAEHRDEILGLIRNDETEKGSGVFSDITIDTLYKKRLPTPFLVTVALPSLPYKGVPMSSGLTRAV